MGCAGQEDLTYSSDCDVRVYFQGLTCVTSELLTQTIQSVPEGYAWLRSLCSTLHAMADAPPLISAHTKTTQHTPFVDCQNPPSLSANPLTGNLAQAPADEVVGDNTDHLPLAHAETPHEAQLQQSSAKEGTSSGVDSNSAPLVPVTGPSFPRAFSNPLYNQSTPGGVPRLI